MMDGCAAQMQGLGDMLLKENNSEISRIILTDPDEANTSTEHRYVLQFVDTYSRFLHLRRKIPWEVRLVRAGT